MSMINKEIGAFSAQAYVDNNFKTITKEDILNDVDAVHYTKDNGVEVKAGMLTAIYDKGIYTYELSDSIFVMYYIVPYEGAERIYVPIRERNLKELVGARKDSDYYPDEERAVYACMDLLEEDITNYRADFANAGDIKLQTVPTLGEYALSNGVTTGDYNFGHTVQISLIEPWGMKVNARVYNTGMSSSESIDYSTLKDYGVVVLYGSDVAVNSAEELLAREDAYVFSSVNGHASISGNVITAIYHQDVYKFEMDTDAYVMFYVQDEDGYHFGPVKVRNLYDLMSARMNSTLSVYTEKEKKVYADMVELYHAITIYREWYFGQ